MKEAKLLLKLIDFIKRRHSHILAAALIMGTILVVYSGDFAILVNEALHNESMSHILLVPFLSGFLLYKRKDWIRASLAIRTLQRSGIQKYVDEIVGTALCLVAFLIYWRGSYTFHPLEFHVLSLPVFIGGIIMILLGLKPLIISAIPLLFLLFLIPLPAEFTYTIGGVLANFNIQASYSILRVLGLPAALQSSFGSPTIEIITPSRPIRFAVGLPCSGIYSLTAFVTLGAFLAVIINGSTVKKATLFLLGLLTFGIMNVIRLTSIILVGFWLGEEAAMQFFHTIAGWILIAVGMIAILFVTERLWGTKLFIPTQESQMACSNCFSEAKKLQEFCTSCGRFTHLSLPKIISFRSWIKILTLLVCSCLIMLSINAPSFAIAGETIEVIPNSAQEEPIGILPHIPNYELRYLYRDVDYEQTTGQELSILFAYFPTNGSDQVIYVDIGVADAVSSLHRWEVCLVTWQLAQGTNPSASILESKDVQLLPDVPVIARYLVFRSPSNYTQTTLYWYERANFNTELTVQQKYFRVSLVVISSTTPASSNIELELLNYGKLIALHWEPLRKHSLIAAGIPLQQSVLILAIFVAVVTETIDRFIRRRNGSKNLRIFKRLASANERMVFQTIQALLSEREYVKTELIAATLFSNFGKTLEHYELVEILNRLEGYGLLKMDITYIKGKSFLVWKNENWLL